MNGKMQPADRCIPVLREGIAVVKMILYVDRDIPFPENFINMTRKPGVAYGLLLPRDMEGE